PYAARPQPCAGQEADAHVVRDAQDSDIGLQIFQILADRIFTKRTNTCDRQSSLGHLFTLEITSETRVPASAAPAAKDCSSSHARRAATRAVRPSASSDGFSSARSARRSLPLSHTQAMMDSTTVNGTPSAAGADTPGATAAGRASMSM